MNLVDFIVIILAVAIGTIWTFISDKKRERLAKTPGGRRRIVEKEMEGMKKWAQSQDRSTLEKIINKNV